MLTNLVRENRKTLSIIIDRSGQMIIKAPQHLPLNEIMKFVKSKEKWIVNKQSQIKNVLEENKSIVNYSQVLYLGNKYEIAFLNNIKQVQLYDKMVCIPAKNQAKKEKTIANWLKNRALSIIENRVLYFSSNYNLDFKKLSFVNSKTKWGSCSTGGDIAFNWRLIMLSPKLIDYVVVHELSHLLQPNHSYKFWKAVESIMPDYEKRKDEIKKCSFVLNLFR